MVATDDPMRAVEEEAFVALVLAERRRSDVPLSAGAYATLAAPGGSLANAAPPQHPLRRPQPSLSAPPPHRPASPQPGPSGAQGRRRHQGPSPGPAGAQGGPRGPPPGFVDLTADDDEPMDTPDSPSPHVSNHEMATDEEDAVLGPADNDDSSSDDGFQHV